MNLDPGSLITNLLSVENGILAGGWILAAYLLVRFFSKKDTQAELIDSMSREHASELKSLRESHSQEIKTLRLAHSEEIKSLRESQENRINEIEDELGEQLHEATAKINELNAAHIQIITDMADKRIEDLKSVTEDYNAMVESVRLALEKIATGISRKR